MNGTGRMRHRGRLGSIALGMGALFATGPVAEAADVVEIFTSQNCASCGPADQVVATLTADPDIVALTFPVDYWDYLGWKDTFARPEFTARQRSYQAAGVGGGIYTPQAVVNGRRNVVGTDLAGIRATIADQHAKSEAPSVPVTARLTGDRIAVTVEAAATTEAATLWVAPYRKPALVAVKAGENKNRTVTYTNVVERWQVMGIWDGERLEMELPLSDIAGSTTAGVAILLQVKRGKTPGPILGATKVDLTLR